MSAYVIVDVEVRNPEQYSKYKSLVEPTIEAYGGRYLARGGHTEILEGEWSPNRIVVLEFESVEQAKAWWSSEEYRVPKEIRQRNSTTQMIVTEGL
jgi:uncharacterized protein (DUF1330 family)